MTTNSRPNILIIDDEISICLAIKDLLDIYNYDVEYATSAVEGIGYLEKNPHTDVVLLDINLGSGPNGIQTLSVLKKKFCYLQVIMFTSINTLEIGLECLKNGALDYVTKPYDETDLLKKIATGLERKKIEQINDLYLGFIVHDLKNPLQNITGTIEYIKLSLADSLSEQHKKFIMSAEKGINQIKVMINNILSISKFEKGTLIARHKRFPLKTEITAALELFQNEAAFQQKQLLINLAVDDDYSIYTDKEFFIHVILNIVSNALRFTPPEGTVTVHCIHEENDFLHVQVTNSGSFIEEKDRNAIFDKYSRIELGENKSNSGQNFGLGLTYCKMAVDAMGGTIWVDGNNNIPETSFHFTIKNPKELHNDN